ncbi:MAG: ribosomal-processing cysteine protease Prp [Synergistaceae bacterium]|jgi:uncharacterized protein YsxB (DUF464 family)|nr:ribosomal-processing cysteine protease Prp [Synergistaceae bacterium]
MLTVTARYGADGLRSISSEGHAGFADEGEDVVCAAVSALMQALLVGLEDVLGLDDVKFSSDAQKPRMSIAWGSGGTSAQQIAITVLLSLKGVAASYPGYVSVDEFFEEEGKDGVVQ